VNICIADNTKNAAHGSDSQASAAVVRKLVESIMIIIALLLCFAVTGSHDK